MHADETTPWLLPWRFGADWPGLRCGAKTRAGTPCLNPCVTGRPKCRMHGGNAGAPKGKRNGAYRHGRFTQEAIEERSQRARRGREEYARIKELERLGRSIGMFSD